MMKAQATAGCEEGQSTEPPAAAGSVAAGGRIFRRRCLISFRLNDGFFSRNDGKSLEDGLHAFPARAHERLDGNGIPFLQAEGEDVMVRLPFENALEDQWRAGSSEMVDEGEASVPAVGQDGHVGGDGSGE